MSQLNLFILLLVSVLSKSLFSLVSRDLMSFSFFTARHIVLIFLIYHTLFGIRQQSYPLFVEGLLLACNRHLQKMGEVR